MAAPGSRRRRRHQGAWLARRLVEERRSASMKLMYGPFVIESTNKLLPETGEHGKIIW